MNHSNGLNTLNTVNGLNTPNAAERTEQFDTIDNAFVIRSLEHTASNNFLNYLLTFIDAPHVQEMMKKYFIGSTKDGKTCFWMIDQKGRARTGKIIAYNPQTGKRDKTVNPSWLHYELKRHKLLPETFEHRLCFFGEHLLRTQTQKPIAIVEAEKTAAIASMFLDEFVWLAIGGKSYLKAEKLNKLKNRKVILFPDADGFDLWTREAAAAQKMKLNVSVSRIIEDSATADEKKAGFDLADYLIRGERIAQDYNWKLDAILASEDRQDYLCELVEERLAIIAESETIDNEEEFLAANRDILRDAVRMAI